MAIEKMWEHQGPILFAADGGADGSIILPSVELLKVKQRVKISAIGEPTIVAQVKRVVSPTKLFVGPLPSKNNKRKNSLYERLDLSAYTVAKGATIEAEEQSKVPLGQSDIVRAVYEHEPTVAWRVLNVDQWGNPVSKNNPLPIDGTFSATIDKPNAIQILNVSSPTTVGQEFPVTLPPNTVRCIIKARGKAKLKMGLNAGDTANNYYTISKGYALDTDELDLGFFNAIFLSSDKSNEIVEIIAYTN